MLTQLAKHSVAVSIIFVLPFLTNDFVGLANLYFISANKRTIPRIFSKVVDHTLVCQLSGRRDDFVTY